MATLLRMPEVAANSTHAVLAAWSKKEGESVSLGECIAEIETDKAVVEVNAEIAGVMGRWLVLAGQSVAVGAPIGVLLAHGDDAASVDSLLASNLNASSVPSVSASSISKPGDVRPSVVPRHVSADSKEVPARIFASPLARRLAEQRGIDLALLKGTGPNGRVVKADVLHAGAPAISRIDQSEATAASQSIYTEIPHSGMRRAIARRLSESKASIPHFYLGVDCRVDRLLAVRKEANAGAVRKLSVNDFVVRAVAVALREVPEANVGWTQECMRRFAHADIAVAVSTPSGLLTPIVREAERKTLSQISEDIADLAARARAGQLRPDEYQGGSFSVSNLGMYGVSDCAAIINPPQAAILAVGACEQRPVVEAGELKVGTVMRCTLSVDHRAIDGALAAQWLAAFQRAIESPLSMLI